MSAWFKVQRPGVIVITDLPRYLSTPKVQATLKRTKEVMAMVRKAKHGGTE